MKIPEELGIKTRILMKKVWKDLAESDCELIGDNVSYHTRISNKVEYKA